MPTVRLKLTTKVPTLTTLGNVYSEESQGKDPPAIEGVMVRKNAPATLRLDPGWYKYRFIFSGHDDAKEFKLKATPGGALQVFKTRYNVVRVYWFEVH